MQQTGITTKEQVREMILLRARELSRQITEAAEDLGERCAERRRMGIDGNPSQFDLRGGFGKSIAH